MRSSNSHHRASESSDSNIGTPTADVYVGMTNQQETECKELLDAFGEAVQHRYISDIGSKLLDTKIMTLSDDPTGFADRFVISLYATQYRMNHVWTIMELNKIDKHITSQMESFHGFYFWETSRETALLFGVPIREQAVARLRQFMGSKVLHLLMKHNDMDVDNTWIGVLLQQCNNGHGANGNGILRDLKAGWSKTFGRDIDAMAENDITSIKSNESLKTVAVVSYLAARVLYSYDEPYATPGHDIPHFMNVMIQAYDQGNIYGLQDLLLSLEHEISGELKLHPNLVIGYSREKIDNVMIDLRNGVNTIMNAMYCIKQSMNFNITNLTNSEILRLWWNMFNVLFCIAVIKGAEQINTAIDIIFQLILKLQNDDDTQVTQWACM